MIHKKPFVIIISLNSFTAHHAYKTIKECNEIINKSNYQTHGIPLAVYDLNKSIFVWKSNTLMPLGYGIVKNVLKDIYKVNL